MLDTVLEEWWFPATCPPETAEPSLMEKKYGSGRKFSSLPSVQLKNVNHLVSKEHVIVPLSQYISFLEWFAMFLLCE
jgi:hypothetical protein